jgi:hypothetical protein
LKETSGPAFKTEIKTPLMEHNPFERTSGPAFTEEIRNSVMEHNPFESNFWENIWRRNQESSDGT